MHSIRNAPARTLVRPANIDCRSTADRILDIITFHCLTSQSRASDYRSHSSKLARSILNKRIALFSSVEDLSDSGTPADLASLILTLTRAGRTSLDLASLLSNQDEFFKVIGLSELRDMR
jgi:hypothetical protein